MPKEIKFDRQAFLLCWIFLLLKKYCSQVVKDVWLLFVNQIPMAMTCLKKSYSFRPPSSRKVEIITPFDAYLYFFTRSLACSEKKSLVLSVANGFSELDL